MNLNNLVFVYLETIPIAINLTISCSFFDIFVIWCSIWLSSVLLLAKNDLRMIGMKPTRPHFLHFESVDGSRILRPGSLPMIVTCLFQVFDWRSKTDCPFFYDKQVTMVPEEGLKHWKNDVLFTIHVFSFLYIWIA